MKNVMRIGPGVALSASVGAGGLMLGRVEAALCGREWLEGLVLAILLGLAVRVVWTPSARFESGIKFAAKPILEVAVVLLGASVDGAQLVRNGVGLLLGIAFLVVSSIAGGIVVGRWLGLAPRLAILVACGNAICGNSAIAALAPVIEADEEQVASAVTFTALGSIAVVVGLPFLAALLHMNASELGTWAGMSVYAVPQVLAATAGAGALAVQTGTLVKLARVLMLGPMTLWFALRSGKGQVRLAWHQMVPPFIIGFAALALLRTLGWMPLAWAETGRAVAGLLTVVAMAALGLASDPRAVSRAGRPIVFAAALSLALLLVLSWVLIRGLRL